MNWNQSRGVYNVNSDIKFKTTMSKYSLSDYSDRYIFVKGNIIIAGEGADDAAKWLDERGKGVISFINYKNEINNTEISNAKDIDIVMSMHNLIKNSQKFF